MDYFPEHDFYKCIPSCSKSQMHPDTLQKLNKARHIAGIPFMLTSAFRSPSHEKLMNRPGTSSHTIGRAVDINCVTSDRRMKIVQALLNAGFTRIGIASTFIHADDDPSKPQNLIWTY